MDSHLDGRTGPQSYIEALPTIQGKANKGPAYYTAEWARRAIRRRRFTLALSVLYHLKVDVCSILDPKNKELAQYSWAWDGPGR